MILVTGASRGIGRAIYDELGKEYKVVGLATKEDKSKSIYGCDISKIDSLKKISNSIKNIDTKLSAIINVAGVASMNLALATPESKVRKIIETNLLGTIFVNQVFAPFLIRNGSGRIINFSTLAVNLAIKGEAVYIASKAGVEGFSRALAKELSPFNITVNCIAPGPIRTDLLKGITDKQIDNIVKQQSFPKVMSPRNVVDQVKLILSKEANYTTGEVFSVGGA